MLGQKFHPRFPINATGPVEQNNWNNSGFAGLHQSEDFKGLVHRAEPAREKGEGVRFLNEVEFAIKKVIEIDQLRVALDYFVGLLFEWQTNVEAKTAISTSSGFLFAPQSRTRSFTRASNGGSTVQSRRAG